METPGELSFAGHTSNQNEDTPLEMSFAVRSDPVHDATEGSFLDFLNENDDADVKPVDYT